MEIKYDDLIEKQEDYQESYDPEYDLMTKIKRNWKFYLLIVLLLISICVFGTLSIDNKVTNLDKINLRGQDIIKLENQLLENHMEQYKTYKELIEIKNKYVSLLSGEKIINNNIGKKRMEIKNLIIQK